MKKVCIFFADGLEECEGLITVDLLRRAGIDVTITSISDSINVTSSHNITIQTDALAKDLTMDDFDMIVLPGGLGGTKNLAACSLVTDTCKAFAADTSKKVAAICAAPSILGDLGLLEGKSATCYPGWEDHLKGADVTGYPTCIDGNIITGKGMGVTIPFALRIIDQLVGPAVAAKVAGEIQYS